MKVQELFKQLVSAAQAQEVSDIYFLVDGEEYVVKFKEIAGLSTYRRMQLDLGGELINYLKYHARMDITEHSARRSGRFNCQRSPVTYGCLPLVTFTAVSLWSSG